MPLATDCTGNWSGGRNTGITLRSKQDPIRSNWWLMSRVAVRYCDYCGLNHCQVNELNILTTTRGKKIARGGAAMPTQNSRIFLKFAYPLLAPMSCVANSETFTYSQRSSTPFVTKQFRSLIQVMCYNFYHFLVNCIYICVNSQFQFNIQP